MLVLHASHPRDELAPGLATIALANPFGLK